MGSLLEIMELDKPLKKKEDVEEEVKKPGMSLFEHLHEITVKKTDLDFSDDNVSKNYSAWMINRFLSMKDFYLPIVNDMNKFDLPKDVHYRFYKTTIPRMSSKQFFPYVKNTKTDLELRDRKYIAEYFDVGLKEAEIYIRLLSEEQIKKILDSYRYGKGKGKLANV
jgi:hypothetical protein